MSKGQPIRNKSKVKASILSVSNILLPSDFVRYLKLEDPQEDEIIKYDGTNWVNSASSSGATKITDLTDVFPYNVETAKSGEILVWNGELQAWFKSNPIGIQKTYQFPAVNDTGIVCSKIGPGIYTMTWPSTISSYLHNMSLTVEQNTGYESSNIITVGYRVSTSTNSFEILVRNDGSFYDNRVSFVVFRYSRVAASGLIREDGIIQFMTYNEGLV